MTSHRTNARAAGVVTATALAAVCFAAPARAAVSTSAYYVALANTNTQGALTWGAAQVTAKGALRVTAGNCRQTSVEARTADGDLLGSNVGPARCNTTASSISYAETIGVAAGTPGASEVYVCLLGKTVQEARYDYLKCTAYYGVGSPASRG